MQPGVTGLSLHVADKSGLQADGGATPGWTGGETPGIGATPKKQRSRWDETPMGVAPSATPMMGATPSMTPGATPFMTPGMAAGMETPSPSAMQPGVSHAVSVGRVHMCVASISSIQFQEFQELTWSFIMPVIKQWR